MTKFSRMHGWMWLKSYASGDGSIFFVWVRENDRNGSALDEYVTESDVSEFLREPENEKKWEGWDILDLGSGCVPRMVLAADVERPFHSSYKLVMGGNTYRYACHSQVVGPYHSERTTSFYDEDNRVVVNASIVSSLCFFLNNEESFCKRKEQRMM